MPPATVVVVALAGDDVFALLLHAVNAATRSGTNRTARWRRMLVLRSGAARGSGKSERVGEAAVFEVTKCVVAVEAREHVARLLCPHHRLRRRDAPRELRIAALVDAVLGPRAGIVLDARNFGDRDAARLCEA